MQSLALAVTLYDQAAEAGDALQMAVAVRLAAGIRLRAAPDWERVTFAPRAGEAEQAFAPEPLAVPVLTLVLSPEARTGALLMAEEDPLLADFLETEPAPLLQGAVNRVDALIAAGEGVIWKLPFDGQSPAEIAVFPLPAPGGEGEGEGEAGGAALPGTADPAGARALSPLWRVEEETGTLVCPPRATPWPACRFTPEANGFYQVVIENPTGLALPYALISN